jgi:hypothetical protein
MTKDTSDREEEKRKETEEAVRAMKFDMWRKYTLHLRPRGARSQQDELDEE